MAKSTGIAQFSQGRSDIHRVDPRLLKINDAEDFREMNEDLTAHIDMLAQSIKEVGVKKPIEAKLVDGVMWVMEGRCRTRAAMLAITKYGADLKTVPVISVDRYANEADLIVNQVIGNSGKPFTTMEEAKAYKKLLDMGWNQNNIAQKVGKSNGRISQILDLLTMPVAAQAMVAAGAVSASLAMQTVKAAETPQEGTAALTAALQTAKADGRSKVRPADTGASSKNVLKDAFDNSDIDNSHETTEKGVVVITMPVEDFEKIRVALGL